MTDKKISELVAVTTVEDTDEYVLARAGASNKITGANLKAAAGGGGGSGAEGGVYYLIVNAVPANNTTHYSWSFAYGTPQLDLTDPLIPVVLTAGVYALTASGIPPSTFTPGTTTVTSLDIDAENNDAGVSVSGAIETFAGIAMSRPASITFYCPAAGTLLALIAHDDATLGTLDFFDKAYVQKIG